MKFSPPKQKSSNKSIRTSIRVPQNMLNKVHHEMEAGGYNKKQRVSWITEAIVSLLENPDNTNLIAEEFIHPGSSTQIPIVLTESMDESISQVIENTFSIEAIEKDRSAFVRTAILQRLLAKKLLTVPQSKSGAINDG